MTDRLSTFAKPVVATFFLGFALAALLHPGGAKALDYNQYLKLVAACNANGDGCSLSCHQQAEYTLNGAVTEGFEGNCNKTCDSARQRCIKGAGDAPVDAPKDTKTTAGLNAAKPNGVSTH